MNTAKPRISSFDRLIFLVIAILIVAIGVTVLLGDRVGARVLRMEPEGIARSTEPIVVQFSESMNRDSVAEHLSIQPPIEGIIVWNANTMIFQPDQPLQPGESYTINIGAGAESQTGRRLLSDQRMSIDIRTPKVAYLAPPTRNPQNIFITDPLNPADTRQITDTESGVFDFAVSPDGSQIAFAEYEPDFSAVNIKLLDLETGVIQQITSCQDASCTTPTWRPDGQVIAYHRVEANNNLSGVGIGPTRIWLVDLTGNVYNNRPLFDDFQIVGYAPRWSTDGTRIAIYDSTAGGILIYDLNDQSSQFVPSRSGTMGTLSPDGTKLVFSDIDMPAGTSATVRNHLKIADLTTNEVRDLTYIEDAVDDTMPIWHPNGRNLAFGRRNVRGAQIYLLNGATGEIEPLVIDESYANGLISWDPTGTQLVMQRFQLLDAQGQPTQTATTEIWTYNLITDVLIRVATDAYLPQWVP